MNNIKTGPKDVFLHLLAILALYVNAASFLTLIFQYVNILIPDPLEGGGYYLLQSAYSKIRWSIATLIVVFPVYIAVSWYLNKLYLENPARRELKSRKWLLYFTLFAAAGFIIGDLVTLIFNLLGGELTLRFFLKILTVLFVAGAVFFYYLWELKKSGNE